MIQHITVDPTIIRFSPKVREQCKSCKRYGRCLMCPPFVDSVEHYAGLLPQYAHCRIIYDQFPAEQISVRRTSSLDIAQALRTLESELREQGHYFILCFGAGSCKNCDSCTIAAGRCQMPDKALVPLEAAGVDVVDLMSKLGVKIEFPVTDQFYRVGAIFYD